MPRFELVALLDNIRSIHNVGSMFRTAEGACVRCLHLAGITATPEHPRLAKAALGAQSTVDWRFHPNAVDAATALKSGGYELLALERHTESTYTFPGDDRPGKHKLVLVVGNEKAGIDPAVLALCDRSLALPMLGQKSSLNAAVAFGIAVYYLQFGNLTVRAKVQSAARGQS